ncbi:MAG TPA: MBL fold metallo-hydrolase, partial [Steroidobacteraceae bacterium]|nr:MBL fold metallo-hydrolase [Steroidobacteraceae bacterium]
MKVRRSIGALALLAVMPLAVAQQDMSKVVIESQKVAEGVYMLTGAGGNIGVSVGEDGIVMIDDQFQELTPRIQEALAKLSPKPVRFVINTHWHFDHVGGNENFGKAGAVILAHGNVRKRMSTTQLVKMFNREVPASPHIALPVVTFESDVTVHYNDEELYVFHVDNAHTDGDGLILFRKANVLHTGDTLFNGFYPFIDVDSGGSIDGMIASADKVLDMVNDQTKIIPGHGPLATPQDLRAFRNMLTKLRENVAKLIQEGKSLEETITAAPTKDLDAVWGKGFLKPEQVVQMV